MAIPDLSAAIFQFLPPVARRSFVRSDLFLEFISVSQLPLKCLDFRILNCTNQWRTLITIPKQRLALTKSIFSKSTETFPWEWSFNFFRDTGAFWRLSVQFLHLRERWLGGVLIISGENKTVSVEASYLATKKWNLLRVQVGKERKLHPNSKRAFVLLHPRNTFDLMVQATVLCHRRFSK